MTSPVQTQRFDSRDPAAIHRFLASTYDTDLRIRAGETGYHLVHQRVDTGPFALATASQTAHLDIEVEDLGGLAVCRARTALIDRTCEGSAHRFGPGDVFLATRPGRPFNLHWEPGQVELCVLDLGVLTQVATAAPARRPGRIRFTDLGPANALLARQWRKTTSYVSDVVLGNPSASVQPLVVGNAARMLAAAALAIFPNTAFTDETAEDRHDASTATLRRAIAFLEENADRDISAADIAGAAAVSLRAVQLAFRRHLGTTPMAYLRRIRLDRAHHDLVRADPRQETVSAIASRWGFASHSRFTARYHASYGVPPRETLHA
ncbi:helix-turn-helix transcriptional regulator [Micromonospora sp. WMMD710]|uniref:helix-turn-helix transcriptional regulator n=1 Tax=Micromonospora sp. WMMD710 TaxID=3016085 RepID=UPI0024171F9B|nr:helix-turn-helix transcriptional regulator [Micromonospora sp. WMMD710]MDG4758447.1 helix-turn-helix transcriptional regulator [Micromonospora sp. WMMD710]